LSLITACGAADDAARVAGGSADDIVRSVGGLSDDLAHSVGGSADDIARGAGGAGDDVIRSIGSASDDVARVSQLAADDVARIVDGEADDLIADLADLLTSEDFEEFRSAFKSAVCICLEADVEGRFPTQEELMAFFLRDLVGMRSYEQELVERVRTVAYRIQAMATERDVSQVVYSLSVTTYCSLTD
jgi:hypothetical protein